MDIVEEVRGEKPSIKYFHQQKITNWYVEKYRVSPKAVTEKLGQSAREVMCQLRYEEEEGLTRDEGGKDTPERPEIACAKALRQERMSPVQTTERRA